MALTGQIDQNEVRKMMEVNHSVVIDRPVDEVFAFVSDARNDPLWETGVEACVPDREPGVGQQRDVVMKVFGRRREGTAEITEYDHHRLLTIETKSGLPVNARTTYEFDSTSGGTRIDLTVEIEPVSTLFKLARPLMSRLMQKQWESDLATLKELLESDSGSTSGNR